MSAPYTLVIIGGGRMGEAIAAGLVSSAALEASSIAVVEPSAPRRDVFERHGIAVFADGHDVLAGAEIVLFAVKPQVIDAVVAHLADDIEAGAIVVSIAAGITTARLEALLRGGAAVVRVMPNTPAMVGAGMAVVSGGRAADPAQVERVRELFEAVGDALVVDEAVQDAATAISGSGPAYVALFADALAEAGAAQGLERDVALRLAVQTFKGTAELLLASGMEPQELIDGVSSPGGTTVAALEALEAGGFRPTVDAAVAAAVRRAKELGS
ncbi:MAG: pyrroline-5-carboxylate reductase [Coriobacteriia bacterium]|nr:pyrroline-5-carboxylate reductase [Coriobacteriia bacterium]